MEIPSEIALRALLVPGAVFYFTEKAFSSSEPHYFVVLNADPSSGNVLVLVNATSNVWDRLGYMIKLGLDPKTLVTVLPSEATFLNKPSTFDCNYPTRKTISELAFKITTSELILKRGGNVSEDLLIRLRDGVKRSDLVEERLKKLL